MKLVFEVDDLYAKARLDSFLSDQIKNQSRSRIQRLIKKGKVHIKGKGKVKSSYQIKSEDIIEILLEEDQEEGYKLSPKAMPINVVYQDTDLIVVDKSSGICSHPSIGNWDNTLLNGLMYKFNTIKSVGKPYKFGLIHRLDKDTSGLIMVALNDETLWYYSRKFEEREVKKYYIAIVKGDIRKLFGQKKIMKISNYIGRNPKNRKKMAVVGKERGRIATTHLHLLEVRKDTENSIVSCLLVQLKTGRTHQIRVHLSELGFPILGDNIYGKVKFSRLLLHAYHLKVKDRKGKIKIFTATMPNDFHRFVDTEMLEKKVKELEGE